VELSGLIATKVPQRSLDPLFLIGCVQHRRYDAFAANSDAAEIRRNEQACYASPLKGEREFGLNKIVT